MPNIPWWVWVLILIIILLLVGGSCQIGDFKASGG